VIVYLTVCTKDRKPLLAREAAHLLLRDAWAAADGWLVGRYVIMPDHLHLFCAPGSHEHPDLGKWVQFRKTVVSSRWMAPQEQPIWQHSFWDSQLRSSESYEDKWEYVRNNPVRKGFCTDPEQWNHQGTMNVLPW